MRVYGPAPTRSYHKRVAGRTYTTGTGATNQLVDGYRYSYTRVSFARMQLRRKARRMGCVPPKSTISRTRIANWYTVGVHREGTAVCVK